MTDSPSSPGADADWAEANERFAEFRRTRDSALRDSLVEANLGLAHHFANRYRGRGLEQDDLDQVALLGLLKAVDRFDPSLGTPFAAFARRYVVGEIRHHFRDRGWDLKVPRGLKELHTRVGAARREWVASTGDEPSVHDLAQQLDVSADAVLEALDAGSAYSAGSLDQRREALGPAAEPKTVEQGFLTVERRAVLADLLGDLDDREREILRLRFEEEQSQEAIAEAVGVSQVHVGRLLRQTLADLRERARDRI